MGAVENRSLYFQRLGLSLQAGEKLLCVAGFELRVNVIKLKICVVSVGATPTISGC